MAAIVDIIHKVLERTNQDKVPWQTTADEETFVAIIGNLSVSVSLSGYRDYFFAILNEEGREIERLHTPSLEVDVEVIEEVADLYAKAKRIALQVDNRLDELLAELTKDG